MKRFKSIWADARVWILNSWEYIRFHVKHISETLLHDLKLDENHDLRLFIFVFVYLIFGKLVGFPAPFPIFMPNQLVALEVFNVEIVKINCPPKSLVATFNLLIPRRLVSKTCYIAIAPILNSKTACLGTTAIVIRSK